MMNAIRILSTCVMILACAAPVAVRAEDTVIEHREIVESTQPTESRPVVIEKYTTIEKEKSSDVDLDVGHGGLVSSTVDLTGEVLALPFKLVGGVFDLVF